MGKKSNNNKKKGKKKKATTTTDVHKADHPFPSNFVSDAGPGCYIARRDLGTDWILEWEDVDPDDFEEGEVPELAMDPEEQTLSVCNTRDQPIIAYITVYETKVRDRYGNLLPMGSTTNNEGVTRACVTFIVLCEPHVFAHLGRLDVPEGTDLFQEIDLESDVQEWNRHPSPGDEHNYRLGFPLQGGPFLCTQGVGGQLTHFFSGNLHAIDFRCPVGTPILAVADGIVVEAKDNNTLTGIAVSNLFEWNTIMLEVDTGSNTSSKEDNKTSSHGPLFVEYVHIQKSLVKEGDRVTKGQVIGESGSVGFSPEPHLHFAAYLSKEPTAPTAKVQFQSSANGAMFLPQAGQYYDAKGLQEEGHQVIEG
jgi:Peptidase family M23